MHGCLQLGVVAVATDLGMGRRSDPFAGRASCLPSTPWPHMPTTAPNDPTAARRRLRHLVLVLGLLLAACTGSGPELTERGNDVYTLGLPTGWDVVNDTGVAHQVAEPDTDRPMTVRLLLTESPVRDVEQEVARLREGVPGLADDAQVLEERSVDVAGATGAVEMTSTATLRAAGSGDELAVRIVDVLARATDGRVVSVKVMGPDDDFDDELAAAVLRSLTLAPQD